MHRLDHTRVFHTMSEIPMHVPYAELIDLCGTALLQAGLLVEVVLPAEGAPEQGGGGLYVNVRPLDGITVFVVVQVAALLPPAVVADQSLVVLRLAKSALVAPRKPTWPGSDRVLVAVFEPYTN